MTLQQYYIAKFKQLSTRAKNVLELLKLDNAFCTLVYLTSKETIFSATNCGKQTATEIIEFMENIVVNYPLSIDNINEYREYFLDEAVIEGTSASSVQTFLKKYSIRTYNQLISAYNTYEIAPRSRDLIERFIRNCESLANKKVLLCKIKAKYGDQLDDVLEKNLYHYIYVQNLRGKELERIEKYYSNIYAIITDVRKENSPEYRIQKLFIERLEFILTLEDNQIPSFIKYYFLLNSNDIEFIFKYKKEHGIIPVFFVLEKIPLMFFTPRALDIFYSYFGFYSSPMSVAEIGDKLHKLPVYVNKLLRQTFCKLDTCIYDLLETTKQEVLDYYPFLNNSFFTESNTQFEKLAVKEKLQYEYDGFCILCRLLNPELCFSELYLDANSIVTLHQSYQESGEIHYNTPFFFVYNSVLTKFDYYTALYQIGKEIEKKGINFAIDWKRFCFKNSLWQDGVIHEFVPDVKEFLGYLLKKLYNISDSDDSRYSDLESGEKVNVRQFLYEYVKAQDKPVSIEEMFAAFKQEYPQYPFSNSKQIRTYVCKDNRLKPIGRTSLYVIEESLQFKGTLQDAVIEVLKQEKEPIAREEIYKKALILRPDSSEKSIRTILSNLVKNGVLQKTEDMRYSILKKSRNNKRKV